MAAIAAETSKNATKNKKLPIIKRTIRNCQCHESPKSPLIKYPHGVGLNIASQF